MIEAHANISDLIARIANRVRRSALRRAGLEQQYVPPPHPWRKSASLWPTFGQD